MDTKSLYLIVFILLSAFFSGSETAMFSLSRVYLKKLENSGGKSAKMVLKLLLRPKRLLVTLLLCNTFVNMAISSFSTLIAYNMAKAQGWDLSLTITIQIILVTIVILIFGEIVPKLLALALANQISLIIAYPISVIQFILSPVVWIFESLSNVISRKDSVDRKVNQRFTHEEFHNLIQSESSSGTLQEHEKRMLVGLFRFREAEISEIYVPRVKITAIEENQSLDDLRELVLENGYSRIPVYRESIDDVIGIIYVKDLLLFPEKQSLTELMRPVWFVTENMKIQSLLNQFRLRRLQVAVVVDEYGGTSGIISLEDILEEIVGEIQDEYDADEIPEFIKLEDGSFLVSGNYSVRQFNQEFSREISVDEYDNMAEFLLAQFNHVPQVGESWCLDENLEFEVLDSDEKSIKQIRVKCHQD
ncbi:MAG: hemolysin family protein [Candidatus Cloacimonadaceae bacterium]|nr:hemolysin family protein [Candidatus Cloacimonadota bacterium]MDY0127083.1 hemolysin family protein [Candidatus Cloacimonadaceae bacterium]MCB5255692.1 hemolysin family protein [Candidatus Cloacimonadota bacterium]MCK9177766.1 hemolysin family protein [Candidatus Cloacimonadota bacterium]MCK9241760.1 hemolysin family protein [Candidatus Cloacimonadota bacterium]